MTWNYRLFKQDTPESAEGDYLFYVGECYYEADRPYMHSDMNHNLLNGDDEAETKLVYEKIAEAYSAPVIELDKEGNFKDGE